MPAAAPVPARIAVGRAQNRGAQLIAPAAAKDRAQIARIGFPALAETTKPAAPIMAGIARCQRRSLVRSALRPSMFMAIRVQTNGMALTRPIWKLPVTPAALTRLGIQKVRPYWPRMKQK